MCTCTARVGFHINVHIWPGVGRCGPTSSYSHCDALPAAMAGAEVGTRAEAGANVYFPTQNIPVAVICVYYHKALTTLPAACCGCCCCCLSSHLRWKLAAINLAIRFVLNIKPSYSISCIWSFKAICLNFNFGRAGVRSRLLQTVTANAENGINVRLCNETGIYGAIKQTKHEYF